ncbi:unnamed protein product [Phytomonas sp. EM1]|nr:unnamed protein product [Phytomonas sp. EM1]|eukprot:CCW65786.1 unnamed protein product [Phytomonas sp. isolate EM1]
MTVVSSRVVLSSITLGLYSFSWTFSGSCTCLKSKLWLLDFTHEFHKFSKCYQQVAKVQQLKLIIHFFLISVKMTFFNFLAIQGARMNLQHQLLYWIFMSLCYSSVLEFSVR